jgi:ribosomal protein S18 acetylase RimI-like enzyme
MIRPTTPGDVAPLVTLTDATGFFRPIEVKTLREVLDDYFTEEQANSHRCVTCEKDGTLLGFAYYAPAALTERAWQLWWIVVRTDLHGRGVGSELLRYVEDDLVRSQARVLFIDTSSQPRYAPTRRFYLKHGYEQHAVLKDFYDAGDDMVVFRKAFAPLAA